MANCKACTSFKDLSVSINSSTSNTSNTKCPASKEELGNASWLFLHTMASYYPNEPNLQQQSQFKRFITDFSDLYPCRPCGEHMSNYIQLVNPSWTRSSSIPFHFYLCTSFTAYLSATNCLNSCTMFLFYFDFISPL